MRARIWRLLPADFVPVASVRAATATDLIGPDAARQGYRALEFFGEVVEVGVVETARRTCGEGVWNSKVSYILCLSNGIVAIVSVLSTRSLDPRATPPYTYPPVGLSTKLG